MLLPAAGAIQTIAILGNLRLLLHNQNLDAYIIPYGGQHFIERAAPCDARIAAISGFTGSAASVIVTLNQAFLWTDGRYYHQANLTLFPDWTLMKDGELGTPSQSEYLNSESTIIRIGVDAKTYPKSSWDKMKSELVSGKDLVPTPTNLVNEAWDEEGDRPLCPQNPIMALPIEYSGKSVADKLVDVRKALSDEGAQALVVSELEEVAWLLNLRGSDLPQTSVFFAYAIIGQDLANVFVNNNIDQIIIDDLEAQGISFEAYANVTGKLKEIQDLPETKKIWLSKYVNAELANSVEADNKHIIKLTPIIFMKSLKNPTEVAGMRSAHLKDSAAIIAYLSWLQNRLESTTPNVTEISGNDQLYEIRKQGYRFMGQSFNTISGFGSNGAIIHYRPTPDTNKNITKDGVFLLDSGGLYWDGTTDITRTVHFGMPSAEQKDRFTRVLKGHIAIATALFPNKMPGHRLDSLARKSLWDIGEDYKHGTGHGIGHFLNVHEGPQKVSFFNYVDDTGLEENMFISNEPGFYKEGEYGIRIENIIRIAKSAYEGWLKIETVSFVPIQTKMIDITLLTDDEIQWVNDYHKQCEEKVLAHMVANPTNPFFGSETQEFLKAETKPIFRENENPSTPSDEVSTTPSDEVSTTPSDEVSTTPSDEVSTTPSDEVSTTPSDEVSTTPSDEVSTTPSDEVSSTPRGGESTAINIKSNSQFLLITGMVLQAIKLYSF